MRTSAKRPLPIGRELREDPAFLIDDSGDPRDRGAKQIPSVLDRSQHGSREVLRLRAAGAVPGIVRDRDEQVRAAPDLLPRKKRVQDLVADADARGGPWSRDTREKSVRFAEISGVSIRRRPPCGGVRMI